MASDMEMPYNLTLTEQEAMFNRFPIYRLVCKEATMPPIVHDYILYYIENRLFTNYKKSGYLMECVLYKDRVETRLNRYSVHLAKQFMDYCIQYPGGAISSHPTTPWHVVRINFEFTIPEVGPDWRSSTADFSHSIVNYGLTENSAASMYMDSMCMFEITHHHLSTHIYIILAKHMFHSKTHVQLSRITFNLDSYPDGFTVQNTMASTVLRTAFSLN